jgi:hypothetical protein
LAEVENGTIKDTSLMQLKTWRKMNSTLIPVIHSADELNKFESLNL